MAGLLKGLNIQIGAETTGLDKALADVNSRARQTAVELKQVNAGLKLDPTSTELAAQKQKVLQNAVMASSDKLKQLKNAQAQVEAQFKNGQIGEAQYRAFQRELVKTEAELKRLESASMRAASVLAQTLSAAGAKWKTVGQQITGVGQQMTMGMTVPLAIAGAASVKLASDFNSSMLLIKTQANASQSELDNMKTAVLGLAGPLATSPDELAKGLYHIESAGFRGATALSALEVAAKGAKVGGADLESVTNALNAVLVAGVPEAKDMNSAMGMLNATVGAGDMRMQDLADAMGTGILAAAKSFGIGLKDVGAALAVFGDNNIRGADAATKLRMAIFRMGAVTSGPAVKALASIGIQQTQLAEDMRKGGLVLALEDLQKHLTASGKSATDQSLVMAQAFGGGKTAAGVMILMQQLDRLKTKEEEVGKGGEAFGKAWTDTRATFTSNLSALVASLQALGITMGNELIPRLKPLVDGLTQMFDAFTNMAPELKGIVVNVAVFAAVLGPLVTALGFAVQGIGAVMTGLGWLIGTTTTASVAVSGLGASFMTMIPAGLAAGLSEVAAGFALVGSGATVAEVSALGFAAGLGGVVAAALTALGPIAAVAVALWEVGHVDTSATQRAKDVLLDAYSYDALKQSVDAGATSYKDLATALQAGAPTGLAATDQQKLLAAANVQATASRQAYVAALASGSTPEQAAVVSANAAANALAAQGVQTDAAGQATQKFIRDLDGLTTAENTAEGAARTSVDTARDYQAAKLDLRDAETTLTKLRKDGKVGTEEYARAEMAAAAAAEKLNDAKQVMSENHLAEWNALVGSTKATDGLTGSQERLVTSLDAAQQKVAVLKAKLDTVPASKRAKVEADIAAAEKNVQKIKDKISGVKGKDVTVKVNMSMGSGSQLRARVASGGLNFMVNDLGGKYTKPTFMEISEKGQTEYAINADRLRMGDARQLSLLRGLLQDGGINQNPAALYGGGISTSTSNSHSITNLYDMRGFVIREPADIKKIAEAIVAEQTIAERAAGVA